MIKDITFAEFCADKRLVGEPLWPSWIVVYKAFDGLLLHESELPVWREMSGRDQYSPRDYRRLVLVKGRRAGGTRTACKNILWRIHTTDFRAYASPNERLHVPLIFQLRDVAREAKNNFDAIHAGSSILRREVVSSYKNQIVFRNNVVVSIWTCSYRAPRGIAVPVALCDELGAWRMESNDADRQVIGALSPAQLQFPGRKRVEQGTPWIGAGLLAESWQQRFEHDDPLVLYCPTELMNPTIPKDELEKERADHPANYAREVQALFTSDVDQFLVDGDITAATVDRTEVAAQPNVRYVAAIDASGLTGGDRFVLAIGHAANEGSAAVDLLRGWKRAPVPQVLDEIVGLCGLYRVSRIVADQYSYSFVAELFRQRNIEVEQLAFSARSKPEIFLGMKNAFSQGKIELIRHTEALRELRILESTRLSGGGYRIAAPRGQHDDYACAIAILIHRISRVVRKFQMPEALLCPVR